MEARAVLRIGLSYHGGGEAYDAYADALARRGAALGIPVESVWLAGKDRPFRPERLADVAGIVLTGGPDVDPARYGRSDALALCRVDPARDEAEFALLDRLAPLPLPLLAVCRGAQLLNVYAGGTLIPDLDPLNATHQAERFVEHEVEVAEGTQLAALMGAGLHLINSSHHQAVDRIAPGFRISGRALDGTVEAFEPEEPSHGPFMLAVQWHPERMAAGSPAGDTALDALLQRSAAPGEVSRGT